MKIYWNNGYWVSPHVQDIRTVMAPCDRHIALGDSTPRKVAVIDASDGEFNPVRLCHEHLVELANELLESG